MDDDDIALADSFINFEAAACSPTSDNPPDPIITEFDSSDLDPPVGSSCFEERIENSGLVEKEVNENESGGAGGEIAAIDDDAVGVESEAGEVRGEIVAVDDNAGMESEGGEIRGDVIAYDDEFIGDVLASDDEIRGKIAAVDDAVGMESEGGEIRGDVIPNDDEVRGEIVANDDEIRGEIAANDDEIRGEIVTNDDEIRGEIVANDDLNATVNEGSNRENECSSGGIKIHEEYELEEGEILESDNDIGDDRKYGFDDEESSDNDIGDDRKDGLANELEILPRVPTVNVKLGPHHTMLPLGVVTSIVGARVVVEGSENHDPLDQGSVLWMTGKQTPLGVIDDTFAQVKSPHYVVRYNSEDEIPEGVHEGTLISFVAEFAKHVLDSKELYKKGSDASGMNDEEVSNETEFSDDNETEFSDDVQEAEHMRIQRQAKRGQSSQNSDWLNNDRQQVPLNDGSIPKRLMVAHGYSPPIPSSRQGFFGVGHAHSSPLPGTGQGFSGVSRGHSSPLLPQQAMPPHSPMSPNLPSGVPTNSVAWSQENTQISHQQPMQGIPSQQQFNPSHRFPPPTVYPGGQPNMYAKPMHAQGLMNQNQWTHFPQFQAPTYFQPVNNSGILGAPPHQFNPPTYFQTLPVAGNLGGPLHPFNPVAYFPSPPIAGNQGGPPHQFCPPANIQSPPISSYQSSLSHQFNPPTNFQSPPISANQHPPQFHYQFNPGASDGRERTFAARRRPSHRGGKGWRPAR
ncbi:unnamed protein product [Lathyrus sativus]|nr:unnamed protein product [Lathyrus sativus]